jgi:Cd2+/Zn2+-exporting ATPase
MSSIEEKSLEGKKLQKSYFDVVGLCCSSEVTLIENILKPLQGIKEVSVIVPSRTVIVVHDTNLISQLQIGSFTFPCFTPVSPLFSFNICFCIF